MLKIGLYGLHRGDGVDPETVVGRAQLAEPAGFESLCVGDHMALPAGERRARTDEYLAVMPTLWTEVKPRPSSSPPSPYRRSLDVTCPRPQLRHLT